MASELPCKFPFPTFVLSLLPPLLLAAPDKAYNSLEAGSSTEDEEEDDEEESGIEPAEDD